MAGIGEFIQSFIGLRNMQINQQEATTRRRTAEAQTTLAGVQQFLQLAQASPDPVSQRAFAQVFADRGVAPKEVLEGMLSSIAPSLSTLQAHSAREGMLKDQGVPNSSLSTATDKRNREAADRVVTGMSSSEVMASDFLTDLIKQGTPLAEGYRTRLATGVLPGDFALSMGLAGLPQEHQAQRAMIAAGTSPSAPQDAQNKLGWAGLRQNERELLSRTAMNEMELRLRETASGLKDLKPEQLLNTKRQLQEDLTKNGGRMTPDLIKGYIGTINGINQMLDQAGVFNEGQYSYDPNKLTQPGLLQRIFGGATPAGTPGQVGPQTLRNPTLQGPGAGSTSRSMMFRGPASVARPDSSYMTPLGVRR